MVLSQQKTPLVEAIRNYLEEVPCRLHMPGHKGKGLPFFSADLTEVPGLDDLHLPAGVIKEAQELAAAAYGARETFFLVNGATAGIQGAILALAKPGDKIILPRHVHKSVFTALVLSGATPVYVSPVYHPVLRIPLGVEAKQWEKALERHPDSKLLLLVNPTYEGITSVDGELIRKAKAKGLKVIIDEAHGGHFPFHRDLPPSGLALGADVVIHGTHKTAGSLTQSGMLHLGTSLEGKLFQEGLALVQTTSPSYLLMASLDWARREMACYGEKKLGETLEVAAWLREEINRLEGICLWYEELYTYREVKAVDPTKIIIDSLELGLTGFELAGQLRENYGVQVEMATDTHVLALFSYEDGREQGEKLLHALVDLSRSGKKESPVPGGPRVEHLPEPQVAVCPRDSWFAPKKTVPLEEAVGSVCGQLLVPYPPGIPLLCPGELISAEMVELLIYLRNAGVKWQGLQEPGLKTVRVLA